MHEEKRLALKKYLQEQVELEKELENEPTQLMNKYLFTIDLKCSINIIYIYMHKRNTKTPSNPNNVHELHEWKL
ncbi:hypothetical protein MTR_2g007720 [Medicago truncatula]|uniref:Uncharacterized protein n=1 Tax=Medicago truncatula TaxID=3880 RepID=G7IK05_MEDTR|nr:hypothetical protein MTR_2g007720 [Medicago truncatula]